MLAGLVDFSVSTTYLRALSYTTFKPNPYFMGGYIVKDKKTYL